MEPSCDYCEHSRENAGCVKRARKRGRNFCRRFRYDPILRKPGRRQILPEQPEEDFEL